MSRRVPVLWVWLFGALLHAEAAQGALRACAALSEHPGEYKVALSDLVRAANTGGAPTATSRLAQKLRFLIEAQMSALRNEALLLESVPPVRLRMVTCVNRQPAFDGSEFTRPLSELLSDNRVALEIWGEEDLTGDAPGIRIGFVIPPLQFYEPNVAAAASFPLAFPRASAAAVSGDERLLELEAFVLAGVGTKALRARQYDTAKWAFGQARGRLAPLPAAATALTPMRNYLQRASCETHRRARTDTSYRGPLRFATLPASCGAL